MPEELITPAVFAADKQICREWAYRLMRRGEVGTRSIGGRLFIIDNMRAWLWKRKREKKEKPEKQLPGQLPGKIKK